jgi:serine protease
MKQILTFLLLLPVSLLYASGPRGTAGTDYRADQFIISVKDGVTLSPFDIRGKDFAGTGYPGLDEIIARENVIAIENFYPGRINLQNLHDVVKQLYVVKIGNPGLLAGAIADFEADPRIKYAEQYNIHHLDYVPNDPLIGSWYHLRNIEAYLAWDFIRGDSTSRPILGIVDSGVYYDHPDLEPNMWINSGEDIDGDGRFTEADVNGIDDDLNDYVDDVVGYDIAMNDCYPYEPTPTHGTHVAGCASMACDNAYGGASVSWGARIMAVKAALDNSPEFIYNGFTAITYAAANGANVINCSWGGPYNSQYEQDIINALYADNIVVVAAAGNESSSLRSYPAGYNHVVAVASVGSTDHLSYFSNYGTWVTVSAPGEGVYSTWDHGAFTALDGTSMASPITAGTICLIKAANPGFTVDQLVQRLTSTADTIDYLNPTRRGLMGAGRVNAAAAIGRAMFPRFNLTGTDVTLTEDDGDGRLNPGERFTLVADLINIWADAQNVTGTLRSDSDFTLLDSVAAFGNIPGHNGTGSNASNPFDVRVNSNIRIGSHDFSLHITAANGFQTDIALSISVTLEQSGFPGDIPANIDAPALVIDFNGDNRKEIVISASNGNYYSFEPDGSQTPGWPLTASNETPGGAAAADLDRDGNLEIIGMSRDGNVYAWNADGTLLSGFPRNCGPLMFSTPVVGDIDGDSWPEIVVGLFVSKSIYVIKHDGTDFGTWPFQGTGNIMGSVALADIDNDSLPEIIYGDLDSTVYVLNADKSEVAGFPVRLNGQIKTTPCVADIDGDGHLNIIVATTAGTIYALDYDGSIMAGWPASSGGATFASPPSLADIDQDGHLEIMIGCNNSQLYAFRANGHLQNGFPVQVGGLISASPAEGDIDGDGYPDIVFGAFDSKIYAIDRSGHMLPNFPIPTIGGGGQITGSAALCDLDGDGDCEIITGVKTSGNNLEVIDYKAHLPQEIFPWPYFGKNPGRTSYYGYFATGIGNESNLPAAFRLEQNYPNPFNGSTVIKFSIPSDGFATLAIYDLLGRRIRLLHEGFLDSGSHEFVWDGSDQGGKPVSSGIYFYKLDAAHTISTRRMTLVK